MRPVDAAETSNAERPMATARPVVAVRLMVAVRPMDASETGDAVETGNAPDNNDPGPDLNSDLDTDPYNDVCNP